MALSDAWLRSVVGKERDKVLVKSDRDGLSVRVSPKGRVVFQYRYQWAGKGERLDIGTYPATGLKEAKKKLSVFVVNSSQTAIHDWSSRLKNEKLLKP